MKDIINYVKEAYDAYPMKGVFKKNDDAIILLMDKPDNYEEDYKFNIKDVKKEIPVKIDKVVSRDVGRWSGDQHTWVYVTIDDKSVRFELREWLKDDNLKGEIDLNYKQNPKDMFGLICTPDDLKKLKKK